jgi:glycerol uptake facilitator-like aquaporin
MTFKKITAGVLINGAVVAVLLVLHVVMYAFAPAVNPDSIDIQQAVYNAISEMNKTLYLEGVIGFIILFIYLKIIFPRKEGMMYIMIILVIDFVVVATSVCCHSVAYCHRFLPHTY